VSILRLAKQSALGLTVFSAFLVLLVGLFAVSANAQTNSTWNGGTGNWSNSSDWNPAAAPNNSGATTYDITIGVANSNVTMDVLNDTIDNLSLDATTSLTITGNTLSLNSGASSDAGMITNNGGIFNNRLGSSLTISSGFLNQGAFISGNFVAGSLNNAGKLFISSSGLILNQDGDTINNSGTLTNAGNLFMLEGVINNSGTLTNMSDNFTILDAELGNSGNFNNYGMVHNEGNIDNNPGAFVTNFGTINSLIGAEISNSGTFLNTSAATVNSSENFFSNSGKLVNLGTINNDGVFTNSGFVNITSTGLFTTTTNYTQTAGKTFVNGTLTATGSAIVDIQAGLLGGGGTINGNVKMAGTMLAGTPGSPLSFIINGNYEQTSTGIYDELIGSNANGLLQVSGAAKLDPGASLDVFLLAGFDPSNGTSFTILDYGSESGAFAIADPFFNGGTQKWVISSYNGGDGDDIVLTAEANNVATTPEPATTLLLGTVLLVAAWYVRKKRSEHAQ